MMFIQVLVFYLSFHCLLPFVSVLLLKKKAEILYVFQKSKPFLSDIQFPNFYMNLL